jgi:hypothetical protein
MIVSKKFFFEKKNQKTFLTKGRGQFHQHGQIAKVFCFFFSKKKRLLPSYIFRREARLGAIGE